MQRTNSTIQSPAFVNFITVLSIDGGGVRGLIPITILEFLEEELHVEHLKESKIFISICAPRSSLKIGGPSQRIYFSPFDRSVAMRGS
uniref:Putative acyl transferase/acyl hydrolase/lysophospholipase n=1 Tax=Helianthus annuus TaxID=4232 RepID=A0A251SYE6_HELAN